MPTNCKLNIQKGAVFMRQRLFIIHFFNLSISYADSSPIKAGRQALLSFLATVLHLPMVGT